MELLASGFECGDFLLGELGEVGVVGVVDEGFGFCEFGFGLKELFPIAEELFDFVVFFGEGLGAFGVDGEDDAGGEFVFESCESCF